MRRALLACLLLCACRAPVPSAHAATPAGTPRWPLRLVDEAGAAQVSGDLASAFAKLDDPLISPSPLPRDAALAYPRALQVAFAEPDLSRLLPGSPHEASSDHKIDLTWNRTSGVYEAREALFLPAGVTYRFTLPPGPAARLDAELGVPDGAENARLVVRVGDTVAGRAETEQPARWRGLSIALPARDHQATLSLSIESGSVAFLGAPVVRLAAPPPDARPNVIFILVDTLRVDALPVMPRLEAFAQGGARFTQAITAATWTRPSLIAALGGDWPSRLGHSAEDMIPSERERRRFYALRAPLLPRRLEEAGYEARVIGNNFFLLGFPRIGLDLGIDSVTDVRHLVLDTPAITAEAARFLAVKRDHPFFLYLHYDGPHWPYTPPPAMKVVVRGRTLPGLDAARDPDITAYLGEAAYVDRALGDLFDALHATGHDRDTVVVLIGDHGEIFDPAHAYTVEAMGQPTLHHHGWSAYDEILRVPFVMVWPGHIVPRSIDVQTSLVDLAPTVEALVGLPPVPGAKDAPPAGRSLAPALTRAGAYIEEARPAFVEGQDVRALREDGWLYLRRSDGRVVRDAGSGDRRADLREELFDLHNDPMQHADRSHDPSAPLARMRADFAELAPSLPPFSEPVVHLAVADDTRPDQVRGEIRSTGKLAVRGIEHGRAEAVRPGVLAIELQDGARLELGVDPPDAPLELQLRRDDIPIDADHLLAGPYAIPIFGGSAQGKGAPPGVVRIPEGRLSWLDATRAPYLGEGGEVVLWRDPSAPMEASSRTQAADSEVATMMQRWGYAQPQHPAHPASEPEPAHP